jgi:hypothetical protein
VNCRIVGVETTGKVPLYPAMPMPAMVADWPTERPCALVVLMVTRKPFSVAPVGLAAIVMAELFQFFQHELGAHQAALLRTSAN